MKSGRPIPKSRATLLNPLLVRRSRQPQQRVDEARIALDRAKSAQLQAALYLSAADDAASTESPSLQELEEALKNATAAADTKEREVKGIEAESAAYTAELGNRNSAI